MEPINTGNETTGGKGGSTDDLEVGILFQEASLSLSDL